MTDKPVPELTEKQKKYLHKIMDRMREKHSISYVPGQKAQMMDGTEYLVDAKGTIRKITKKARRMTRAERNKLNKKEA